MLVTIGPVISPVAINPGVGGFRPARRAVSVIGKLVGGLVGCGGADVRPAPVGPARQGHGATGEEKFQPGALDAQKAARGYLPKVGHPLPPQVGLENRPAPLLESVDDLATKDARRLAGNGAVDHRRGSRSAILGTEGEGAGSRISPAPEPDGYRGVMLPGAGRIARTLQSGKRFLLGAGVMIRTLGRNIKVSAEQKRRKTEKHDAKN